MLIKILKGEELFSEQGTHICDENGKAIIASEDTECEVLQNVETVKAILKDIRYNKGLDENGDPLTVPVEIKLV